MTDNSEDGDGFNVAEFPCNYITYINFNTKLLNVFYLLINTPTCLAGGHIQGARTFFDMCSLLVDLCGKNSTYIIKCI